MVERSSHFRRTLLGWLVAGATAAAAAAQVTPHGGEFQVNAYTTSNQLHPAVAVGGRGEFVVVWLSDGSYGTDRSGWSVQAQRFGAGGTRLGEELQVNTYTTQYQRDPEVAADEDGRFVVVWHGYGSFGTDTDGASVQAQRFAADSAPLGDQFQVNTHTEDQQRGAAVATGPAGDFVVAWTSDDVGPYGTGYTAIQAQRYDSDGIPLGGQLRIDALTATLQRFASVAVDEEGGFVVAWQSYGSETSDTDFGGIHARRFAADGAPLGPQFQVNTYTTSFQSRPDLAMLAGGGFVVAWESYGSDGSDPYGGSIQARRFDADGEPQGDQFEVNDLGEGNQYQPSVAPADRGGFVVVWSSNTSNGDDDYFRSVQARRFDADGTPSGPQFQVNTYTPRDQDYPAVASTGTGDFVVAWTSDGSYGTDTDYRSVHAQIYDALFRDGFESGDLERWSASAP